MKISLVIPNFNGEKLLRRNLPVVLTAEGISEVIVVDDGSTDKSVEAIKNEILRRSLPRASARGSGQELIIIENEKNLGFSSAVNRGVRKASGEIVVLLNTDVVPEPGFLKPLLVHFEDPQVFAVGCLDKSIEDGKTVLRGRGVGRWERGFLVHARGEIDKTNTLWVSGGSGAFRKGIWENLGGLDEIYNPFYWEDIDLSYRAQKAGYKVLFEPQSKVVHRHKEGVIKQKYSLDQIKTVAFRNQFIFVWKNIEDPGYLFDHIFWLPYHLLKSAVKLDFTFWQGFLAAVLKLPQILRFRLRKGKFLAKSDREILANFT